MDKCKEQINIATKRILGDERHIPEERVILVELTFKIPQGEKVNFLLESCNQGIQV